VRGQNRVDKRKWECDSDQRVVHETTAYQGGATTARGLKKNGVAKEKKS